MRRAYKILCTDLPPVSLCFLLASASTEFFQFPFCFEAMMGKGITQAKSKKKGRENLWYIL